MPDRICLSRAKGWRMPPNTVKVARPGKWGNPFRVAPVIVCEGVSIPEITPASAVALHREWLVRNLTQWPSVRQALDDLRGQNLACWCSLCEAHRAGKPLGVHCEVCAPCHADTMLEFANSPAAEQQA